MSIAKDMDIIYDTKMYRKGMKSRLKKAYGRKIKRLTPERSGAAVMRYMIL